MKKALFLLSLILVVPSVCFGAIAAGWNTPSLGNGYITPTPINGIPQGILISGPATVIGTTTLATTTTSVTNGIITVDGTHYPATAEGINAAIQTCLNTQSVCGEVYIPAGLYVLDYPILWDGDRTHTNVHMKIVGAGIDSTHLMLGNGVSVGNGGPRDVMVAAKCWFDGTNCFLPAPSDANLSGTFEVSDMTLDYNGANQTYGSSTAAVPVCLEPDNTFLSTYIHNIRCENTFVPSFSRGSIKYGIGIDTIGARNLTIEDSQFINNDEGIWVTDFYAGFRPDNIPVHENIFNNYFSSSTDAAIYYEYGSYVNIQANKMVNGAFGIYAQVPHAFEDMWAIISGNFVATTTSYGMVIDGSSVSVTGNSVIGAGEHGIWLNGNNNTLTGNIVENAGLNNTDSNENGIYYNGANGVVSGNTVNNAGRVGIQLAAASSTSVVGNQIYNAGQNTDNTFSGIFLSSNSKNNIVTGNTIVASSTTNKIAYGIRADSGSTNNTVANNIVLGAETSAYNLNSTTGYLGAFQGGFAISTSSCVTTGFCVQGNSILYGNVGIHDTTPTHALDITGTEDITTASSQNSLTFANTDNTGSFNWELGQLPGDGSNIQNAVALYTSFGGAKGTGANLDRLILTSGGTQFLPTGSLAIGTSTSLARLDVVGANNGTVPLLNLYSVSSFATTTQFTVLNNGNVGIGVTIPTHALDVVGKAKINATSDQRALELDNSDGNGSFGWTVGQIAGDGSSIQNALAFYTDFGGTKNTGANLDRLILVPGGSLLIPTGKLGIGTTSPYATLSVQLNASSTAQMAYIIASTTNVGSGVYASSTLFSVNNMGSTTIGLMGACSGSSALQTTSGGLITCGSISSSLPSPLLIANGGTATTTGGVTNGVEYYNGSTLTNDSGLVYTGQSSTGFVGIGSSTPGFLLTLQSSAANVSAQFEMNPGGTSLQRLTTIVDQGGNGVTWDERSSNSNFIWRDNGTERMRLSSGKLGIGTTGPGSLLSVTTGVSVGTNFATFAAPTNGLIVQGTTGIGTSSPYALLSVHAGASSTLSTLFAVASTTNVGGVFSSTTLFAISNTGWQVTSGPLPTASSCGSTNVVNGNQTAGDVMLTGTLVTSCTITFAQPVPPGTTLNCLVGDNSTVSEPSITATTTSSITIGLSASVSTLDLLWQCGATRNANN